MIADRETHHSTWSQLVEAVHTVCAVRGDVTAHRDALLGDCRAATPEMQLDLLAHFEDQARMYRDIGMTTGGARP